MEIKQEVGKRIRRIRVNKELIQEDVAKLLDITPSAYAKIERGETDPSITRLYDLAKIFKVDIIELLKDENEIPSGARHKAERPINKSEFSVLFSEITSIGKRLTELESKMGSTQPAKTSKKRSS